MLKTKPYFLKWICIFVIPIIVSILTILLKQSTGPYWLSVNSDPAYQYLFNSLYLLNGISPIHVDHPGTTLQILGAIILKFNCLTLQNQHIPEYILKNPEFFLSQINYILVAIAITLNILLGAFILNKTKNVFLALFSQLSLLFYLTLPSFANSHLVLPVITNITPDTLLISINTLFSFFIFKSYFKKNNSSIKLAFLWGIVCGAGINTKLTFIPIIIVALIILSTTKTRLLFLLGCVTSFFFFLIPVLAFWEQIFGWTIGLVTHTGIHGTGERNIVNLASFSEGFSFILFKYPMLLAIAFIGIIISFIKNSEKSPLTNRYLLAISLGIIATILMVIKHPGDQYLMPAIGLIGPLLFFGYEKFKNDFRKPIITAFICVIILGQTIWGLYYNNKLNSINNDIENFSHQVYEKYQDCIMCGQYRSSSPEYALHYADDWVYFGAFRDVLNKIHPNSFTYLGPHFKNFKDIVDFSELKKLNPCILIFSKTPRIQHLNTQLLEKSTYGESLFKVNSSKFETGHILLAAAKNLINQRKIQEGYMLLLKAKELNVKELNDELNEIILRLDKLRN